MAAMNSAVSEVFSYEVLAARILFGSGRLGEAGQEVARLGCGRALILTTASRATAGERLSDALGPLAVGVFAGAVMHTPVEVTEAALGVIASTRADSVIAYGGGSTIGLGKAIALRTNLPQVVIPTTYSGSEVTPILGETQAGLKITKRDRQILPETVIYDPELTVRLPVEVSMASGLNAMAHALEGLYAQDRNPVSTLQALAGVEALYGALPAILANPANRAARSAALYGAWLCGTVLGTVGMSLHHKLCHTLGGSFGLPHAETHAAILPQALAYNEDGARAALAPLAGLFGPRLGAGLFDFAARLGVPLSLRALGLAESDLDRATRIATQNPYWNPVPVEPASIRQLLQAAWAGRRPD
jgi:maleylacetate reductase